MDILSGVKRKVQRLGIRTQRKRQELEAGTTRRAARHEFRAAEEAERKLGLSQTRTVAAQRRMAAEEKLGLQRTKEQAAVSGLRTAHMTRQQAERALRAEKMRPYREAAIGTGKVVKEVGKSFYQLGKGAFNVLVPPPKPTTPGATRIAPRPAAQPAPRREVKEGDIDLDIDLGESLDFGGKGGGINLE